VLLILETKKHAIQISTGLPSLPTKGFLVYYQYLKANFGSVYHVMPRLLL